MMIKNREYALGLFFGTLKKDVFNGQNSHCVQGIDVSAVVGQTILNLKKGSAITDGGVDYAKIRQSEAYAALQQIVYPCLRSFEPSTLEAMEQKLAFWINLYNLLTIDAVLQFSVRKGVTEGWFGNIQFFRRAAYQVGGLRYSLEDIEHGILRANRGVVFSPGRHFRARDPRLQHALPAMDGRIHFALNCASRSCPPIGYYSGDRIHTQLDLAAANFIQGETQMDKSGVALRISRIFKWYQRDFGGRTEVLEWIRLYLPEGDMRRKLIENFGEETMTIFNNYDWNLNVLS